MFKFVQTTKTTKNTFKNIVNEKIQEKKTLNEMNRSVIKKYLSKVFSQKSSRFLLALFEEMNNNSYFLLE